MATPSRQRIGPDVWRLRTIPDGFANPLRANVPSMCRAVRGQTVAEMRAYCRVWGIVPSGPWLAAQEARTGPHPDAYAPLPITRGKTYHLPNQLRLL